MNRILNQTNKNLKINCKQVANQKKKKQSSKIVISETKFQIMETYAWSVQQLELDN